MRIAFISPSLANKGPVIVTKDLCQGLIREGHTCKIFYFDDIIDLEMPCEVERISFFKKFDFAQWDVVHSNMLRPDLWMALHKPYSKNCKTHFVTTLHNPITHSENPLCEGWLKSHLASVLWCNALRRMDNIVLLNAHTLGSLPRYLQHKSSVIFNGRDIERTNTISNSKDREAINRLKSHYKIIGSVSSIDDRKSLNQVVEALVALPDFAYVAVGDGPKLSEIKKLAIESGVSDRCYFVGYTPLSTEYYSAFDVFVMTSRSEGFPLSLVEASAYGLPTVLSDIKVFKAIIPNNKTILSYRIFDCTDLADKIDQAYRQRELFSNNITQFYKGQLTTKVMVQQYISLYGK